MPDISALLRALPVSGLEPQLVATIAGFSRKRKERWWEDSLLLLEPPAGQHVPFIDPVEAMAHLFEYEGIGLDAAPTEALTHYLFLREDLAHGQRVRFYDYLDWEPGECIPLPELIRFLRENGLVSKATINDLDRALAVVMEAPIFLGPDNWCSPLTIAELPDLPPAKSMIEFVPGPPWDIHMEEDHRIERFAGWRESIRPIAESIEKALGEPVYYFADPDCDYDDDNVHRFLVLHWLCTFRPESTYIKFLLSASGARNVEELKDALTHPGSYFHPFKMNDAFVGMETRPCRLEYGVSSKR